LVPKLIGRPELTDQYDHRVNHDGEDTMDEADKAFLNSFIPPGWASDGFVAVVLLVSPDGESRFKVYNQIDGPLTTVVGALRLAEHQALTQAWSAHADSHDSDNGSDDD
jgi:hypothetical protein